MAATNAHDVGGSYPPVSTEINHQLQIPSRAKTRSSDRLDPTAKLTIGSHWLQLQHPALCRIVGEHNDGSFWQGWG